MIESGTSIGIAWYLPEQWSRFLTEMDDPEVFENTHAEWLALVEHKLAELHRKGVSVRKVILDIDEFKAWCNQRRAPLSSKTRSEFVADMIRHRGEKNEADQ